MRRKLFALLMVVASVALICAACQNEGAVIICGNCAARLPEASQYCSACGAQLYQNINSATDASSPLDTQTPQPTVSTVEPAAPTVVGTNPAEPPKTEPEATEPTPSEPIVTETVATEPPHTHVWIAATCEMPKICSTCGVTSGSPEHAYENGECKRCGAPKASEGLCFGWIEEAVYVLSIGQCTDTNIVIPDTYQGKPVIGISSFAFSECTNLLGMTIPGSVTDIGQGAFLNCTNLLSVSFGENSQLISIGNLSFAGCRSLASISIPNSVTNIGASAFSECASLPIITIPNGVTSLGESAFYRCTKLTSVIFEEGSKLPSISYGTFYECRSLTSIEVPKSVANIGKFAFHFCTGLTSISVEQGNSVYRSDGNCLIETATKKLILGCSNSIIPIDGSITCIGDAAFLYCSGLTNITIPDGVTSIGDEAFLMCNNLTEISFLGTKSDWKSITFGYLWGFKIAATGVNCVDGIIGVDGNEIYSPSPPATEPTPIEPTEPTPIEPTEPTPTESTEPTPTESVVPTPTESQPTEPEYLGVTLITGNETFTDTTIEGDVYITSTGVVTFKNVTVNGNVYCYGKLTVSGGSAQNLYAYYWDLGGITSSCNVWDGTHGLVKGAFKTCDSVVIEDNALDYAFATWGKK